MEYLTIKELILASEGKLVSKYNEDTIVNDIVIDSRKANENRGRACETNLSKNCKCQKKSVYAQELATISYGIKGKSRPVH